MYRQPRLEEAFPKEVHVGRLSEVYVNAKEDAPFWQRKFKFYKFISWTFNDIFEGVKICYYK